MTICNSNNLNNWVHASVAYSFIYADYYIYDDGDDDDDDDDDEIIPPGNCDIHGNMVSTRALISGITSHMKLNRFVHVSQIKHIPPMVVQAEKIDFRCFV